MFFVSPSLGIGEASRRMLRRISLRSVPILVGAVLLTASALKTHQLATGPTTEDSLFTSRWFLIALVEVELALSLCLLSGANAKQARRAALAVFTGFGLMSLYRGLTGASSRGCFGKLHISPWHSLLFDLAAGIMLGRWTPESHVNICGGGARSHSFHLIAIAFLFLLAGIPAAIAMSSARSPLLQCSPPTLDFGTMPQGERGEITFWLSNPNLDTVEIAKTSSSCDCLHFDLDQRTVTGGEMIRAVGRLELDKEPRFTGELQVDIQGVTPSGAVAFSLRASVRVVRK